MFPLMMAAAIFSLPETVISDLNILLILINSASPNAYGVVVSLQIAKPAVNDVMAAFLF
ncbi:hypothetical protein [Klebsiella pneumoniae]|uniref:hypothetical protein n=1 Tax=Klebsiella pneumoniae TaxID=573 RepID=UPI00149561C1|nr:hypothetical protein [Klebsiella pneumoniae]